ncbi:MAG: nucleotide exchange factor GrpE [Persephonella sp.]|nr:MAG: nucleotide exchange factor GrpE [Persephonella sp.]
MSEEKKEEKGTQREAKEKKENSENQINDEKEEKTEKNPCEDIEKEINELREKLKKTEEIAKNLSLAYKRLEDEFENYKIRMRKEKEEAKDEGALRVIKSFIEIVDNFEKALESAKTATDINAFIKGVQMIHYQLNRFLQDHGMEKIEVCGEFNPIEHEAIETVKAEEHQPNSIVKVIQTGYKYKGKVIRPAKVVVAVEPNEENQNEVKKEKEN